MTRRPEWLAMASLVGAMAWFLVRVESASHVPNGPIAHDIYEYFYPTIIAAVRAVRAGRGVFWNPFQDCGQPMFGEATTGLLYPPGLLFFFLSPHQALYGLLFFNLTVATLGAYLLCRELELGVVASWCGGLAFGLSNASTDLLTGTPILGGSYVWLPAAMLFCERILRRPTLGAALGLAVTTGIALLPGHPQAVFFLYQLVALRVVWELASRRGAVTARMFGMLVLGLALAPLLVAVQLVPNMEILRLGTRAGAPRSLRDISPGGFLTWSALRIKAAWRWDIDNPFQLIPWVTASAAVFHPARARLAGFWLLAGGLALVLALGPNGFLFPLYMRLPLGTMFSDPSRFLLVTSFAVAVLVGIGVDALLRATTPARRLGAGAALLATLAGYDALSLAGFRPTDGWAIGCVLFAVLVVVAAPRARAAAALTIVAALALDLLTLRQMPYRQLLPDDSLLYARAPLFSILRGRLTAQDRIYLAPRPLDFSLEPRSGTLMGVPVLYDYLPQPTRRWATYFVKMRTGTRIRGIFDWGLNVGGWFPPGFRRPLLDVAAGRYVVVADDQDKTSAVPGAPLHLIARMGDVRVYENPTALPRARFVPRVEVVADAEALLDRLAAGGDDPARVALVEEAPGNFFGDAAGGAGTVDFTTDEPEHVVLRVHAPARGFVVLADQDFPGWHATVDGAAVPITRADYVFRLVPVPAGDSTVEFRYRPTIVVLGAAVSAATAVLMVALLFVARRA